jgi:tyrosyl-tRNA synthetase
MLLRRLQQTGHKPIALMGGGTTKIGDPSGKDESRKILSVADINRNLDRIKTSFGGYLKFSAGDTDAVMVNNADWLDKLNLPLFPGDLAVALA